MSLTQIAEEILVNARRLDEYTKANDLPPASFDQDVLEDLPAELEESRRALVDSTQTLKRLALGPVGTSKDIIFGVNFPSFDSCHAAIWHFHNSVR